MQNTRLRTIDAKLESVIAAATPAQSQQAAWAAARWAVERVGLVDPLVQVAISGQKSESISLVVAALDEKYFELDESGLASEGTVSIAFSHARAANAVESAINGKWADAIYEAAIATDDRSGLRQVVESALKVFGSGT